MADNRDDNAQQNPQDDENLDALLEGLESAGGDSGDTDLLGEDDLLSADEFEEIEPAGGEAAESFDNLIDDDELTGGSGGGKDDASAGDSTVEMDPAEVAAVAGGGAAAGATAGGDDSVGGKKGKKFGKKPSRLGAAKGGKSFKGRGKLGGGKTSGKGKFGKRERKPIPAAAPRSTSGSIKFICSECYEEFHLAANYSDDSVTCPDCLHVGKRPDEDFLRTVNLHKSGERKSLLVALVVGVVLLLELLLFVWLKSPYGQEGLLGLDPSDDGVGYGLLGAGGVLLIVFLWLLTRFEGNRWEVYF